MTASAVVRLHCRGFAIDSGSGTMERTPAKNMELSKESVAVEEPVSLWAIVMTDVFAHILAWMLAFVVLCSAAIFVHFQLTGQQREESWTHFAIGVTAMAAVLYGLVRWRAAIVTSLLANGRRVSASLDDYFSFGHAVRIGLSFEHRGHPVHQKVVVVHGKRATSLKGRPEVCVAVHPDDPRRVIIADLFEQDVPSSAGGQR